MIAFNELGSKLLEFVKSVPGIVTNISSETIQWSAIVLLHAATVPSLLALHQGITDSLMPIEMILLLWAGLVLLFFRAVLQKDSVNILTIGLGFAGQATLLALTFLK
jgi:phage-related minor tail protein